MECKTINEIQVGDQAEMTRTVTLADIYAFAGASMDLNPVHVDPAFAKASIFGGQVAHGMLTASMLSAILGTQLPGVGTIYLGQTIAFTAAVFPGDRLTAGLVVTEVNREKNRVILEGTVKNQDGKVVLKGESKVMAPKQRAKLD